MAARATPPADDDPLAADDTSPYASLVVSALVASTPVLTMLFTLFACGFVIHHNRRLPQLCSMRVVLSVSILLWVCSTLASDVAFWHTIDAMGAWKSSDTTSRELVCKVQVVARYGVAEPLTLLLILGVFQRKSTVGTATPLRAWRLIRVAASITLLIALVHAGLLALLEAGAMPSDVIGPRPAMTANYSSSWPLASSPPSAAPSAEAADQSSSWWRAEGCAGTYGTFTVSTIFVAVYELFWTITCMRLVSTVINLKLRARLRTVQLTFTVAPPLLVLLRALLLWVRADWYITRRCLRTSELLVTLVAALVAVHALILRPVVEDRRLENEPKSGGGLGLVVGAPAGSCEAPHPSTPHAHAHPHAEDPASRAPTRTGFLSPAVARLLFLGRPRSSSRQRPTLSVAVDLNLTATPAPAQRSAGAAHNTSSDAAPPVSCAEVQLCDSTAGAAPSQTELVCSSV